MIQKNLKARKRLTARMVFRRIWGVGSLGWMTIIGFNVGWTMMVYNDLSTEELRFESKLKRALPGSYDRWKAGFNLRTVIRNQTQTRNQLIVDSGYMVVPPFAVLLIAFLFSLLFTDEEEGDEGEKTASA